MVTILLAYSSYKSSSSGVQTVYEQDARALPILSDHRRRFLIDLKEMHTGQARTRRLVYRRNGPK